MYPDANQLAQIRADAAEALQDNCAIKQWQKVADGTGGKIASLVTVAASQPCLVQDIPGGKEASQGVNTRVADKLLLVAWTAPLTVDCVVTHGGHTYEIWELADDQSIGIFREALLKRVDPAT